METFHSSGVSFVELLETLPDPREAWKVRHKLSTIIFCTISRGFVWSGRLAGCCVVLQNTPGVVIPVCGFS